MTKNYRQLMTSEKRKMSLSHGLSCLLAVQCKEVRLETIYTQTTYMYICMHITIIMAINLRMGKVKEWLEG